MQRMWPTSGPEEEWGIGGGCSWPVLLGIRNSDIWVGFGPFIRTPVQIHPTESTQILQQVGMKGRLH